MFTYPADMVEFVVYSYLVDQADAILDMVREYLPLPIPAGAIGLALVGYVLHEFVADYAGRFARWARLAGTAFMTRGVGGMVGKFVSIKGLAEKIKEWGGS